MPADPVRAQRAEIASSPQRTGRRSIPRWLPAVVLFAVASWLVVLPLGLADQSHLPTCACGDVAQEVWFFSLAHASLVHDHLSFVTGRIDAPVGISLLDNASFPFVALTMAPVTAVVGPVAALVIALRLSFFLSAVAAYLLLRRLTSTETGAALGAAVYAFSPYMTHQGASHFFLVLGPLPPVMLYLVQRMLAAPDTTPSRTSWPASHRRRPAASPPESSAPPSGPCVDRGRVRSFGLVVGVLAVLQFFIDSEVLVMVVLVAALTAAVLGLARLARRLPVRRHVHCLASVVAWSLAVAGPLLAYPAWETVRGPQHLVGATQPLSAGGVDLLSTFLPADGGILAGAWRTWRISPQTFEGHNSFVGIPLVVACAAVVVADRRRPLVVTAAVMGAVAWLLGLGGHLQVGSHATAVPLPFDLLQHTPVLQDVIPGRFAQFVDLSVAVLVAVGVDLIVVALRRARSRRVVLAAVAVAMLAGVAILAPIRSYGATGIGAARGFRSATASGLVRGGTALAYPYPAFPDDQAMLWQAESGMRFSLLGGYAIRPGRDRRSTRLPLVTSPTVVADTWLDAWADPGSVTEGGAAWRAARTALPSLVRHDHLTMILVQRDARDGAAIAALVRSLYGPSRALGDVDVWDLPDQGVDPAQS